MRKLTHTYQYCKISPRNADAMGVELGVASLDTGGGARRSPHPIWARSGPSRRPVPGNMSKRHLPATPSESIMILLSHFQGLTRPEGQRKM